MKKQPISLAIVLAALGAVGVAVAADEKAKPPAGKAPPAGAPDFGQPR